MEKASVRRTDSKLGNVFAPVQRNPVLGRHRNPPPSKPEQEGDGPEEVDQVGVVVSSPSIQLHPLLLSVEKEFTENPNCKEYQNFNAFLAIIMGLNNQAVSRLSLTWEKLPNKFRKMFTEFELIVDSSRNHRAYRAAVGKLQPPVLPFLPLLVKDMTCAQEGHKTVVDGLVNFEKMHLFAQTIRTLRYSRSRHLTLEPPSPKSEGNVRLYISCLRVVDNQKQLMSLSQKLEPRRS
ncbi:hypothetical protein RUM44_006756 [Polyplax serrata]|uniref:Ras-GEF domain-containing protein n=1 Tax=Polyplax serrata TaxID=468196 RepID=A0ABR1AJ08_POLSC